MTPVHLSILIAIPGQTLLAALPWGIACVVAGAAGVAMVLLARRLRAATARARRAEQNARLALARSERDQARLGKLLHDGPVQDLLAMGMEANLAAHLGGSGCAPEFSAVTRQLRDVSEALRPPALGAFGLGAALTGYVERLQARHPGLSVSLDLDDDALAPAVRLALFRIAQEAVGNAATHAPRVHVDIRLATSDTGAMLTVRDDGQGWEVPDDAATLARSGRFGMFGMLAQAESVGGSLVVRSVADETTILATAPRLPPAWP